MSHEAMLENLKAELDHLDVAALQSIREIINQAKHPLSDTSRSAAVPKQLPVIGKMRTFRRRGTGRSAAVSMSDVKKSLAFAGKNLTLEEHERLSLKERALLKRHLKEQNDQWLQEKFSALDAAWLVVVDNEVVASGKSLKDKPRPPQILEICRQTGKFPFVFVNDQYIMIEESASSWHKTTQPGDYYPTLPVTLRSASKTVEIVGDFDTGASHTFLNFDFLAAHNLIRPEVGEDLETHLHLNQSFDYIDKFIHIELPFNSGKFQAIDMWIACVLDWRQSPFVTANPNRTALIGRDILLELKPKVLLDFEKRQTEIGGAASPRRSRQKSSGAKKRPKPRSSRRR